MQTNKTNGSTDKLAESLNQREKQRAEQEFDETLRKLLRGDVQAGNEYAAFIVQQLRNIRDAGDRVDAQLAQGQRVVEELKREQIRVSGIADQYIMDLKRWLKPVEKTEVKKGDGNVEILDS